MYSLIVAYDTQALPTLRKVYHSYDITMTSYKTRFIGTDGCLLRNLLSGPSDAISITSMMGLRTQIPVGGERERQTVMTASGGPRVPQILTKESDNVGVI